MTDLKKEVLDRVLKDIQSATALDSTAHSTYISGLFEDGIQQPQSEVLDRVVKDIQSAKLSDTTAHSSYVSGVFED